MTLFLTGASGLVGSNVARVAARRGHAVIAVIGTWTDAVPGATRTLSLDLARESDVQRAVLDVFPDAIINCAAISSPALCAAQPEHSHRLNVGLPRTLALIANHVGARLIHLSSEQVFDGTSCIPYRRDDAVNPPNLYGLHKVESEQVVAQFAAEHAVALRLPLLGGNSLTGRRSFHERFFADWSAGRRSRLYRDEIRQPCSGENVAEVLVELIERRDFCGVMHWAGAEALTRVEMGRRVAAHFRLPADELIEEAHRGDDPGGAARQPCLRLDCAPLAGTVKTRVETFDELLEKLLVPPPCRDWFASLGAG